MIRLLPLAVTLSAFAYKGACAVSDYCPSGSLGDTAVALVTAGEDFVAEGCSVTDGTFVTLDATQLPTIAAGTVISASFEDGSFGASAGIQFEGPSALIAAACNSINIRIANNVFGLDGAIRLYGSLPPNSNVFVTGNTLSVTKPIFDDLGVLMFAAPIYMYAFQDPFVLNNHSGYSITDNTLSCSAPNDDSACFGVGLWATLTYKTGAWLDVSRNTIAATGTAQWWSDGIDCMQDAYIAGEGTRITMDYNNITLKMGGGIEPPLLYTDKNHNSGLGDFSAFMSISHNRFLGSLNPSYPEVIYIEAMVLTASSVYNISHNYIEVYGTDGRISNNGLLTLYDKARLNIDYNTIITNGGTPQINTRTGGWIFYDTAVLWVADNYFYRNDTKVPNRPFFQFDYRFMMINTARVYFINNNLDARNTSRSYYVLGSTTNSYVYKADDARIKVCYNRYFGTVVDTDAALKATLTLNVFVLTDEVAYCWNIDPPTTTSVDGAGTDDPLSNAPSGVATTSVAAALAIAVAVATLVLA